LVHVVIIQQVGVSINAVFFIEIVGTHPVILFDDNENCHKENNKKWVFEDAEFLQQDVAKTDDDHSWLKRNDTFIPMSHVTQPTNSYVCNPSISPGEIPNVCGDFRVPRKRFKGANANNIGKLSRLIISCISMYVHLLQHI
jgi:hypothetical protein